MKRFGQVIKVKPSKLKLYKKYHTKIWPEVAAMITKCHIKNYSIYHKDGYLFAYFEYFGKDFKADLAKMAADPKTQEWWAVMEPMQVPLKTRKKGEWWADMELCFHQD